MGQVATTRSLSVSPCTDSYADSSPCSNFSLIIVWWDGVWGRATEQDFCSALNGTVSVSTAAAGGGAGRARGAAAGPLLARGSAGAGAGALPAQSGHNQAGKLKQTHKHKRLFTAANGLRNGDRLSYVVSLPANLPHA